MLREYIQILLEKNAAEKRGIDLDKQFDDKLRGYILDGKNYFVSYTSINKVGINPRSKYDTPIGVYTYPVSVYKGDAFSGDVPFAQEQLYIQVLYSDLKNIVQVYDSGDTSDDTRWFYRAHDLYEQFYGEHLDDMSRIKPDIRVVKEIEKKFSELDKYDFVKTLPSMPKFLTMFNKILYGSLADIGDMDSLREFIEEMRESENALYRDLHSSNESNTWKAYDIILSVTHYIERTIIKKHKEMLKLPQETEELMETTYVKTGFGLYWNVTRIITNSSRKWTRFLLSDGIDGVVDYGAGLIHPNEPAQAVFLNPKSYKHVDTLDNPLIKNPREDKEYDE